MSRDLKAESLGVASSFWNLGLSTSLNWRTHVLFLIPATATTIFFDSVRLGGPFSGWFLVTVLGILATVLTIEALSQIFQKSTWLKPRPFIAVTILLAAGLARGVVIYLTGGWLDILGPRDLVFRLVGGPAFVMVAYLLFNQIVNSYLEGRQLAGQLAEQKEELKTARDNFKTELDRLYNLQRTKVGDLLTPAIWELGKHLGDAKLSKDASNAIASLRTINDQVVRPLSKNLGTVQQLPEITQMYTQVTRLGQFVLPRRVPFGQLLPLAILALTLFVVGLSTQVVQVSFIQALVNTIVLEVILILELWVIRRALYKVQVQPFLGVALSVVVGALIGLSVQAFQNLPFVSLSDNIVEQTVAFFCLSLPIIFILALVQRQRQEFFASLRHSLEEMRVLTSKLRSQAWLNQKLLATKLHGSLQAALYSSAMRLAKTKDPSPEDFERVEKDVQKAFSEIEDRDYLEGQSAEQVFRDMSELWQDTCQITFEIDESVSELLRERTGLARCVVEVCREAITNATKHGQAENIAVTLLSQEDLIRVEVENDGLGLTESRAGYGTELIDQLTHQSSLQTIGDKVVFRALIAVLD